MKVGVIFLILKTVSKYVIQLLLSKVYAFLYLSKDSTANPHPLKKIFSQNIVFKKSIWKFLIYWGGGGGKREVEGILFIPKTVSKYKIQLLFSEVCTFLYLSKDREANLHPIK